MRLESARALLTVGSGRCGWRLRRRVGSRNCRWRSAADRRRELCIRGQDVRKADVRTLGRGPHGRSRLRGCSSSVLYGHLAGPRAGSGEACADGCATLPISVPRPLAALRRRSRSRRWARKIQAAEHNERGGKCPQKQEPPLVVMGLPASKYLHTSRRAPGMASFTSSCISFPIPMLDHSHPPMSPWIPD
ncbi:hypothetical protein DFH09DRAFT_172423 [Mycena vulgaris]|nr:hypothetical protein DFH09DRAFT_172423 [Mycena vulgaris]